MCGWKDRWFTPIKKTLDMHPYTSTIHPSPTHTHIVNVRDNHLLARTKLRVVCGALRKCYYIQMMHIRCLCDVY